MLNLLVCDVWFVGADQLNGFVEFIGIIWFVGFTNTNFLMVFLNKKEK
jgi:hypothetical protein